VLAEFHKRDAWLFANPDDGVITSNGQIKLPHQFLVTVIEQSECFFYEIV